MDAATPGDLVIHYKSPRIVALSTVAALPTLARRPEDLSDQWDKDGRLVRTIYRDATQPIDISEIPADQIAADRAAVAGPFAVSGVKFGYFFPISTSFSDWFMSEFEDRFERALPVVPAEAQGDARTLLRRLIGVKIETPSGRENMILSLTEESVLLATDRRPEGSEVPITDVQNALTTLRTEGRVTIHPDSVGYRSAFVGAVLLTIPGTTSSGSPPVISWLGQPDTTEDLLDEGDSDGAIFESDLEVLGGPASHRGEQGLLRTRLIGSATHAECALCGDDFPVQFLVAAHIKRRSVCSDDEKRDIAHVAMLACMFGCDALYETGWLSVDADGRIIVASAYQGSPVAGRLAVLDGRGCTAHTSKSSAYFAWHHDQIFRGTST